MTLTPFITRWTTSAAAERANYQLFLSELCDALEVPRPDPATVEQVAAAFVNAPVERVAEVLEMLAGLGQVEVLEMLAGLGQVEVMDVPEIQFMVAP